MTAARSGVSGAVASIETDGLAREEICVREVLRFGHMLLFCSVCLVGELRHRQMCPNQSTSEFSMHAHCARWLLAFSVLQSICVVCRADSLPRSATAGRSVLVGQTPVDDREVYLVTSKLNGRLPKIGPARHASIAICPHGVSPVVYENGVAVSNCAQCDLYGTQPMESKFRKEGKRYGVQATKVVGMSASSVERRMRSHSQLNLPMLNDCRHHAGNVLNLPRRTRRRKLSIFLQ